MKYVLPVYEAPACDCSGDEMEANVRMSLDDFGVRTIWCLKHGPWEQFTSMEFDSLEELEAYRESL